MLLAGAVSVRPTRAYSGPVKPPMGTSGAPAAASAPARRWWPPRARRQRRRHDHGSPETSPAAKTCARSRGRRRPHETLGVESRRRRRQVQPVRVGRQPTAETATAASAVRALAILRDRACGSRRASARSTRSCRIPPARPSLPRAAPRPPRGRRPRPRRPGCAGPDWKSCTREPKAWKMEATWRPVIPPPITSMRAAGRR